jgi:hypothetical protein
VTDARVHVSARPLWRIRLAGELPRYALYAAALWGALASARYAIAPPRPPRATTSEASVLPDRAAEAFAVLFARRYLTWAAARPQAYAESLAPFAGEGLAERGGVALPSAGSQEARWAEVVQERLGPAGERVYTVACETAPTGLLYLSVSVLRTPGGALALAGYPAFVGPPAATAGEDPGEAFRDVEVPALRTVVERALRNFLAGQSTDLAADLAAGAAVSLPAQPLAMGSLERLKWIPGAESVLAAVQASDARGVQYTLQYELDVAQVGGRWEVSAIQMNPDAGA